MAALLAAYSERLVHTKKCSTCRQEKAWSLYVWDKKLRRRKSPCRSCHAAAARKKRRDNPEWARHEDARNAAWRKEREQADPEWAVRRRAKDAERKRLKQESDPEYAAAENARKAAWLKTPAGQHARQKSRIKRRAAMDDFPQHNYEKEDTCCFCGKHLADKSDRTLEHIIPVIWRKRHRISAVKIGSLENLATACASCNSSKHDKLPLSDEWLPRVKSLLGCEFERFSDLDNSRIWWQVKHEYTSRLPRKKSAINLP